MYDLAKLFETLQMLKTQKEFVRMKDLLDMDISQSKNLAVVRCDVERDLPHHLDFAQKAHQIGIPCTFYFHSRKECYDPQVFKEVQALGHEVGFHHECIDRCMGDFESAKTLFAKEVSRFKKDGFFPETVCAHGESGLFKSGYRFNYELFNRYPDLLSSCGVSAEVYNDIIPKWKPVYVSDVFSSYRHFWDKIEAGKTKPELMHLLIHPHRWHSSFLKSELEVGIDLFQAFKNKTLKYRSYNAIEV